MHKTIKIILTYKILVKNKDAKRKPTGNVDKKGWNKRRLLSESGPREEEPHGLDVTVRLRVRKLTEVLSLKVDQFTEHFINSGDDF